MKRNASFLGGIVLALVGLGFVMPAVAQMRDAGALPTVGVGLLLLGIALMLSGGGAVLYVARRLRA